MKSLEQRLQLGMALSLILIFAVLWFLGHRSMDELTQDFIVSRLEHDLESLEEALQISEQTINLQKNKIPPIYTQFHSGHYYVVNFTTGRIFYSHSLADNLIDIPDLDPAERTIENINGPTDQKLLLLSIGVERKNIRFTIGLAEDITAFKQQHQVFKERFTLLALLGLLFLLLIQTLVLRLTIKSLDKVKDDVRHLEEGQIVKLSENVPEEILHLVHEFNHLLTLLEQRLERSRHALGNLAHALKGPLNLLYQFFDSDTPRMQRKDARLYLERINQLMNRELKRARVAGQGLSSQRFNPYKELPELVLVVKQIYSNRHLNIHYAIDKAVKPFADREDMLEMIGNLLDNAGKWANSEIKITLSLEAKTICFQIEDDGKGIDEHQTELLIQRGERLDETVDGHGLGLSIVKDIVKLYSGNIMFERSESLGGMLIKINLNTI